MLLIISAFYLAREVVIIPCGLFVEGVYVCAEKIFPAVFVHVLRHGDAPLYVFHVLCGENGAFPPTRSGSNHPLLRRKAA